MIYHCTEFFIDLQAPSMMPLFFLLSGFSLTVVYGLRATKLQKKPDNSYGAVSEKEIPHNNFQSQNGTATFKLVSSTDEPPMQHSDASKMQRSTLQLTDGYELNIINFHRNRFARVFPVFYTCTIFALPYWFYGFGRIDPRQLQSLFTALVLDVTAVISLSITYAGKSITATGWTVCTLAIMWIIFPVNFRRLHLYTNTELVHWLVAMYWLQLVILIVTYVVMKSYFTEEISFYVPYTNPLLRYPCFAMGVFGGELCLRHHRRQVLQDAPSSSSSSGEGVVEEKEQSSLTASTIGMHIYHNTHRNISVLNNTSSTLGDSSSSSSSTQNDDDWPRTFLLCFPLFTMTEHKVNNEYWSYQVQRLGFILPMLFVLIGLVEQCVNTRIYSSLWLQTSVPFMQLEVIVGLTKLTQHTATTKFLSHPICVYLGKLSMCIYLIHYPLIQYLNFIVHGKALQWPDTFDCSRYINESQSQSVEYRQCEDILNRFHQAQIMPLWGIFVIVPAALGLAVILYNYVEEPCRQLLRAPG